MGTLVVADIDEFWDVQDRLAEDTVSRIEYDRTTNTISWSGPFDLEVATAYAASQAGDPIPDVGAVSISSRVTVLEGDVAINAAAIAALDTSGITTNAAQIATNVTNIATNTSDIATNATNIATNTSDIATNTADIATNAGDITAIDTRLTAAEAEIAVIVANRQVYNQTFTGVVAGYRNWDPIPGVTAISVSAAQAGQWVFSAYATDEVNGRAIGVQILLNGTPYVSDSVDGTNRLNDSHAGVTAVMGVVAGDVIDFRIGHNIGAADAIDGRIAGAKLF
jgi:hypothetical protein